MIEETEDFEQWFNNLKILKPNFKDFKKMHIYFKLGLYLQYFSTKKLTIMGSSLGYKISILHKDNIVEVIETVLNKDESIKNYVLAIKQTFKYLKENDNEDTPF